VVFHAQFFDIADDVFVGWRAASHLTHSFTFKKFLTPLRDQGVPWGFGRGILHFRVREKCKTGQRKVQNFSGSFG